MTANLALINLSITMAGIFLCFLGIFQVKMIPQADLRTNRYFRLFFLSLLFFAFFNLMGQLLRGQGGRFVRIMLYFSNYMELTLSCLVAYIASRFFLSHIDPDKKRPWLWRLQLAMLILHVLLMTVSVFTNFTFTITEGNFYQRTAGYPLTYLMPGAILLLSAVLLIRSTRQLSQRELIAFWLFLLIPTAAMVVQLFLYGVSIVLFSLIFVSLVLYIYAISAQSEAMEAQAKELSELKVSILTEQIQPHFIYNTMNTAYLLSAHDPEQARSLIRDFVTYLKSNITALSSPVPHPFPEELKSTQAYVGILLTRYRGRFSVEYEPLCTDFSLPPLTLQPLVENAIKHGVLQSDEPDRLIRIRSQETETGFEISVEDNGPGFDPHTAPSGESTHIGLENVRERIRQMCGGDLFVETEIGKGTRAVIRIPKNN